jgi:hypothetical protein
MKVAGHEVRRINQASNNRCKVLSALVALVKKSPEKLLPFLPSVAEVMIGALDPSRPAVRKACLKSSTKGLHELVKRYPMASFNQVCVFSLLGRAIACLNRFPELLA